VAEVATDAEVLAADGLLETTETDPADGAFEAIEVVLD